MLRYGIRSLGNHDLPRELTEATEQTVDDVLRRAATFLGRPEVSIERVIHVMGCVPCTNVVASTGGVTLLVATPDIL